MRTFGSWDGSWHTLRLLGDARIGITMDVYGHLAPADMRDQVIPALDGYGAAHEGSNVVPIRSAV